MNQKGLDEITQIVAGEYTSDRVDSFTTGKGPGLAGVLEIGRREDNHATGLRLKRRSNGIRAEEE